MLAARELLDALAADENGQAEYQNHNSDYKLEQVLDFYGEGEQKSPGAVIRYADGSEEKCSI